MSNLPDSVTSGGSQQQPRLRRQSLGFSALFCVVLFGLSLLLIAWRVEQVLVTLSQDRTARMVRQVVEDGENGMRLGLTAGDLGFLTGQFDRMARQEPAMRLAFAATPDGQIIAQWGDRTLHTLLDERWNAALLSSIPKTTSTRSADIRHTPRHVLMGLGLQDPVGATVATVWTVLDPAAVRAQVQAATTSIVLKALPFVLLTFAVAFAALYGASLQTARSLQRRDTAGAPRRAPRRWLQVALVIGLLTTPLAVIGIAREASRPFITAQIEANANVVSAAMAGRIERAVQLGVPLSAMNGLDALFAEQLAATPELSSLALRDAGGRELVRSARGAPSTDAVLEQSTTLAAGAERVVVGYPADYVDRTLGDMLIDLLLALVISAVLMRELTRGLWRRSLLHPLFDYRAARLWQYIGAQIPVLKKVGRGASEAAHKAELRAREALGMPSIAPMPVAHAAGETSSVAAWPVQMTRLRLAVFLVALSEELLRPFFTVLASEMATKRTGWSPEMLAGIPVAAFMATFAAAQPLGPWLMRRFDLRPTLMLAVLVGAGALAGTAWVHEAWMMVTMRAIGGVAYGLALILVQSAVVRFTPPAQRARGLTEVATAIVAAGIVGPPFGGMIAGRVGDSLGMLACSLAMLLAFAALWRLKLPSSDQRSAPGTARLAGWKGYVAVMREPRAMCIILGSAVPARLVAVTVLSIVVPLQMRDIGEPAAMAGRILLLYFLCYSLMASVMAHWSDALGDRRTFIVAGCIVAALACLAVPLIGGTVGMAVCCALLGAGQATQAPSQIAMVTELFEKKPLESRHASPEQALVAYRLIERFGSVIAPFLTAFAVLWVGLPGAVGAVGVLIAVAGGLVWFGLRPRVVPESAP